MTIEEYIGEVMQGVDVSTATEQRIRKSLETELFELVEAGKTPEEAMDELGYPEVVAAELVRKYDDDVRKKQEGEGQPPMMLAWGLMLSALLFVIKGLQFIVLGQKPFDGFGALVGFLGLIASGIYLLWFRKKNR